MAEGIMHQTQTRVVNDTCMTCLCITVTNPCGNNNGKCSHFCLLSATNASGYSCACPDSLMLDDNHRDCISKSPLILKFLAQFT